MSQNPPQFNLEPRSEHRRRVGKYTINIFKGFTKVYNNVHVSEPLDVDVIKTENTIQKGVMSLGTVGLSEFELTKEDGSVFPTRVEFCAAVPIENDIWISVLSTAAFIIMRRKHAITPGIILENVFSEYDPGALLPHLYLTYPFYWNDGHFPELKFDGLKVNWLQGLAIYDSEKYLVYTKSADELDNLFEEQEIDILDPKRKSVFEPKSIFDLKIKSFFK